MENVQNTFLEAYNTHSESIFRFCLFKLSDRELAKDFMQETFSKAWILATKKNSLEIKCMRAILYKIAGNLVVDEYRRRGRRESVGSLDMLHDAGFDASFDDSDSVKNTIDGKQAVKLISKIQEPYGEAVFMRYVQGLDLHEMAKIAGASQNTMSVRVHRGILILKKLFNQNQDGGKKYKYE